METIVIVVAHPDDVAFCVSGTLLKLKDRYKLHVICATRGEVGVRGKTMEETAAIREKEEAAACALLGAELTFLDRIDRQVFADQETSQRVADLLLQIRPRAVFTLWPIDSHPDHSAVSEITRKAFFLSNLDAELYYFPADIHSQAAQFDPDLYVDITSVMDKKNEVIRCHQCQNTDDTLVKMNMDQCRIHGLAARVEYAEVFKGPKKIPAAAKTVFCFIK